MPVLLSLGQDLAIWALPVLTALCGASMASAWAAGRPQWNPVRQVDPLGTLLVPALMVGLGGLVVGWPRHRPLQPAARWRLLASAAAGPLANLAMAIAWAFVLKLAVEPDGPAGPWQAVSWIATAGERINLAFLVLSLLPVPGFAGARALVALAPAPLAARLAAAERHRLLIVVALLALLAGGVLEFVLAWPLLLSEGLVFALVQLNYSYLL